MCLKEIWSIFMKLDKSSAGTLEWRSHLLQGSSVKEKEERNESLSLLTL